METNNRNYKNPTVIAWEQLRQLLTQFADRMQNFDAMAQKQGRDIGVDEVFNEIQNIRKQLDEIQKGLNLQNNTINTERVVDKSQPETPFSITNNNRNDESKNMNKKLIRLTESDLHRIVKESVNKILKEGYNQFSDSDFGSDGDPYGFFDNEELEDNLNGYYGSFNHIWVKIMNDGKPNAYIMVGSNMDNQKQAFEGEEAQRILDKIRYDADNTYGTVQTAIYRNLYKYVL